MTNLYIGLLVVVKQQKIFFIGLSCARAVWSIANVYSLAMVWSYSDFLYKRAAILQSWNSYQCLTAHRNRLSTQHAGTRASCPVSG